MREKGYCLLESLRCNEWRMRWNSLDAGWKKKSAVLDLVFVWWKSTFCWYTSNFLHFMLKNIKIIDAMNSIFFFSRVCWLGSYIFLARLHVLHPSKNKYKKFSYEGEISRYVLFLYMILACSEFQTLHK